MYQHTIQINLTPDQLGELVRGAVRSELATYTPPLPQHPDLPDYLTRKETAALLRISLVTLFEWSRTTNDRKQVIEPLHVNGRVRYRRADVLALAGDDLKHKRDKSTAKEGRGV